MSNPTSALSSILSELNSNPPPSPPKITSLLSSAKRHLLTLNALLPTSTTPPEHLRLARSVLETGALLSIRLHEPDAFTRYFQQLQPFYEIYASASDKGNDSDQGQRSKITGLYLLLLLTKGDYAGFHTVLEGLEVEGTANEEGAGMAVEGEGEEEVGDKYIQYPIKLERWLMEGSYDRVWGATKREGVPSEEFGEFSEVSILGFPPPPHLSSLLHTNNSLSSTKGPNRHHPLRNRVLLRKSLPFTPHRQRQELALPTKRRQRRRLRSRSRLARQGRPDLLPATAG